MPYTRCRDGEGAAQSMMTELADTFDAAFSEAVDSLADCIADKDKSNT